MASHDNPRIQLSAYEDIAEIAEHLKRAASVRVASEMVERILDKIDLLAATPYLGPLHHDPVLAQHGYRKLIVGRYIVVYRVDDDVATVLRVFHGARDYARFSEN